MGNPENAGPCFYFMMIIIYLYENSLGPQNPLPSACSLYSPQLAQVLSFWISPDEQAVESFPRRGPSPVGLPSRRTGVRLALGKSKERKVPSSPLRLIRRPTGRETGTCMLLALLACAGTTWAAPPAGPTISFNLSLETHVPTELEATLEAQGRAHSPALAQAQMNRKLRWAVAQLKPVRQELHFYIKRIGTMPGSWNNGKIVQWLATGVITFRSRNLTLLSQMIGQLETRLVDSGLTYHPLGVNRAREHLIVIGIERIKVVAQKACQALGYARPDILHVGILRTPRFHTFRPLLTMATSIRPKPAAPLPLVRHRANIHLGFATKIRCTTP